MNVRHTFAVQTSFRYFAEHLVHTCLESTKFMQTTMLLNKILTFLERTTENSPIVDYIRVQFHSHIQITINSKAVQLPLQHALAVETTKQ